jgi:hypothetical protein
MEEVLARVEERLATIEVERGDVAGRLARVAEAIETGGTSPLLSRRLVELEAKAAELAKKAEDDVNMIEYTQAGLAAVRPDAASQRKALDDWNQKSRHDGKARARLAVVLRELLARVVLPADRALPPVVHFR